MSGFSFRASVVDRVYLPGWLPVTFQQVGQNLSPLNQPAEEIARLLVPVAGCGLLFILVFIIIE